MPHEKIPAGESEFRDFLPHPRRSLLFTACDHFCDLIITPALRLNHAQTGNGPTLGAKMGNGLLGRSWPFMALFVTRLLFVVCFAMNHRPVSAIRVCTRAHCVTQHSYLHPGGGGDLNFNSIQFSCTDKNRVFLFAARSI